MHVTIIALGSRGDVTSYAVLGGALRRAGHQVRLAPCRVLPVWRIATIWISSRCRGMPRPWYKRLQRRAAFREEKNILRLWAGIRASYGAMAKSWAERFSDLTLLETDVFINQLPGGLFGWDLAEKSGRPMLIAAVIPLAFTRTAQVMGFPALRLPGYNAISYRLAEQLVWSLFGPVINRWRVRQLDLPPHPRGGYFAALAPQHTLPEWFQPAGRAAAPGLGSAHPHNRLLATRARRLAAARSAAALFGSRVRLRFLSASAACPFRIVAQHHQDSSSKLMRRSGQRGILHAGWAGLAQEDLPEHIYKIDDAPYDWLIPAHGHGDPSRRLGHHRIWSCGLWRSLPGGFLYL
jgi:sterol 3beta-glucosyltransferase